MKALKGQGSCHDCVDVRFDADCQVLRNAAQGVVACHLLDITQYCKKDAGMVMRWAVNRTASSKTGSVAAERSVGSVAVHAPACACGRSLRSHHLHVVVVLSVVERDKASCDSCDLLRFEEIYPIFIPVMLILPSITGGPHRGRTEFG